MYPLREAWSPTFHGHRGMARVRNTGLESGVSEGSAVFGTAAQNKQQQRPTTNVSDTLHHHDGHYSKSPSFCPRHWRLNNREGQCFHLCWNHLLTVPKKCYVTLVENLQFDDVHCLKYALSKGLGIGIVVGGSIVKIPQILLSTSSWISPIFF